MASVQELLLALESQKSPFQSIVQGLGKGFAGAQDKALENAKTMIALEQNRQEQERQAQMDREIKQAMEAQNGQRFNQVGGAKPVLPTQKIQVEIEQDEKGRYSRKFKVVPPKEAGSLDAIAAGKVERGEMTLEEAYALKNKGQGDSPSLAYQKEKDSKERIIPGYTSSGQVQLDDVEVRNLRSGAAEFETFKEGLASYKSLIQKYGTQEITDRNVAGQMGAYAKNLQLKVKNLAQLGVLSASDVPFIEQQIPGPGIFKTGAGMLGALDTAEKLMATAFEKKLKLSGYAKEARSGATVDTGGTGDGSGGAFDADVISYAQKHSITPAQALQIKMARTGGRP